MFVPIILGSDKTTVSVGTGHNEYWPIYLSIGNIRNNVRRAHRDGLVLMGFLPIAKSESSVRLLYSNLTFNISQRTNSMQPAKLFAIFGANFPTRQFQAC